MKTPFSQIAIYESVSFHVMSHRIKSPIYYCSQPVELNPIQDKFYFLDKCAKLPNNWDGYGAKTPSDIAIKNAKYFIGVLPSSYQKMLNIDKMAVTPYGTVVLDWHKDDDHFISIEIGNSKIGYLSETPDGKNPYEQGIEFTPNSVPAQVISAINKVFSF